MSWDSTTTRTFRHCQEQYHQTQVMAYSSHTPPAQTLTSASLLCNRLIFHSTLTDCQSRNIQTQTSSIRIGVVLAELQNMIRTGSQAALYRISTSLSLHFGRDRMAWEVYNPEEFRRVKRTQLLRYQKKNQEMAPMKNSRLLEVIKFHTLIEQRSSGSNSNL